MIHKFLSMNDEFQVLQNWLISYPMVRPPRESWVDYPEYKATVAAVDAQPEQRHATHFVAADEADECLMLVNQTFVSVMFGAAIMLPAYDKWMLAEDKAPSLRRHADNLRLIGADEPQRRWLIKNPSYVLAMREFFSVYPDARIVWTHRHPQEAMGSLVEMLSSFGGNDPKERAERELSLWAEGVRLTEEARSAHGDAFFDIEYRSLMADPVGIATTLFEWFGHGGHGTDARPHAVLAYGEPAKQAWRSPLRPGRAGGDGGGRASALRPVPGPLWLLTPDLRRMPARSARRPLSYRSQPLRIWRRPGRTAVACSGSTRSKARVASPWHG